MSRLMLNMHQTARVSFHVDSGLFLHDSLTNTAVEMHLVSANPLEAEVPLFRIQSFDSQCPPPVPPKSVTNVLAPGQDYRDPKLKYGL